MLVVAEREEKKFLDQNRGQASGMACVEWMKYDKPETNFKAWIDGN